MAMSAARNPRSRPLRPDGQVYASSFSDTCHMDAGLNLDGSCGFHAAATGGFTPIVGVGIQLYVVRVPAQSPEPTRRLEGHRLAT